MVRWVMMLSQNQDIIPGRMHIKLCIHILVVSIVISPS
jgi:hypothetical protein